MTTATHERQPDRAQRAQAAERAALPLSRASEAASRQGAPPAPGKQAAGRCRAVVALRDREGLRRGLGLAVSGVRGSRRCDAWHSPRAATSTTSNGEQPAAPARRRAHVQSRGRFTGHRSPCISPPRSRVKQGYGPQRRSAPAAPAQAAMPSRRGCKCTTTTFRSADELDPPGSASILERRPRRMPLRLPCPGQHGIAG